MQMIRMSTKRSKQDKAMYRLTDFVFCYLVLCPDYPILEQQRICSKKNTRYLFEDAMCQRSISISIHVPYFLKHQKPVERTLSISLSSLFFCSFEASSQTSASSIGITIKVTWSVCLFFFCYYRYRSTAYFTIVPNFLKVTR